MEEYNENIQEEVESIIQLTKEIFEKFQINIQEISDLSFLQNEQFYFEVFKTLFKTEEFLEDDVYQCYKKSTSDKKIQILIDLLSDKVLGVDFQDIKGSEIHSGNVFHIRGFLELILALAEVDLDEVEEQDIQYIEEPNFLEGSEISKKSVNSQNRQDISQLQEKQSLKEQQDEKNYKKSLKSNKKNSVIRTQEQTQKLQPSSKKQSKQLQQKKTIKRNKDTNILKDEDRFDMQPKYTKNQKNVKNKKRLQSAKLRPRTNHKKIKKGASQYRQKQPLQRRSVKYNIQKFISNPQFLKNLQFLTNHSEIKHAIEQRQLEYNTCLTDFLKVMQKNQKNPYSQQNNLEKIFVKKQRKINAQNRKQEKLLALEEQANYLHTRDMMLNYLKKLNTTIFKVKKSEKIEQERKIKEELRDRKKITQLALKNIENFYKDQKSLLKDRLNEVQLNKEMLLKFEKSRMKQAQKQIVNQKQYQMNKLIQGWTQKRRKVNSELATERELLLKMNKLLNN